MQQRPRSKSAPPVCLKEVGDFFFLREDESSDLYVDECYLNKFTTIQPFYKTQGRSLMVVDDDKILKLYPRLVDVSVIVRNMNLARTKVPVPQVYDFGLSGNCAYILMQRIMAAAPVQTVIDHMGCKIPRRVTQSVERIVADLASLGLSHNDMYPWNVMVDRDWVVKAIIDWDDCCDVNVGREYWRRALFEDCHDWDHFFLKFCDPLCEILHAEEDPHKLARQPPLIRYPLGRSIGP